MKLSVSIYRQKTTLIAFISGIVCLLSVAAHAQFSQPGQLDTSFNFGKPHGYFNDPIPPVQSDLFINNLRTIAVQPDGKHILAAPVFTYKRSVAPVMSRFFPNGIVDTSFSYIAPGLSIGQISCLKLQVDGKILFGSFPDFNGSYRGLARLHANGRLDTSFNISPNLFLIPVDIDVQPDGKIVVVGDIRMQQGPNLHIIRLNTNGSIDPTFIHGLGPNQSIRAIAVQPNNKLIVCGGFTTYNGAVANRIVRLNENGSLDPTFITNGGANGQINTVLIQPDSKILIGGHFNQFGGISRGTVARLNSNGGIDLTFNPAPGIVGDVRGLAIDSSNHVIAVGYFFHAQLSNIHGIIKLNATGSIDTNFQPIFGADYPVEHVFVQSDQKIVISGTFSNINYVNRNWLARLHPNGALDVNYFSKTGPSDKVNIVLPLSDGRLLLGGRFMSYSDSSRRGIARIYENGILDTTFNTTLEPYAEVRAMLLQPDGKVIIAGKFSSFAAANRNGIARLHPNGALDTTFNPGVAIIAPNDDRVIKAMVLQPNGKIVIAGNFTLYNGQPSLSIRRLNVDGTLDTTFIAGVPPDRAVDTIIAQPDGKLIVNLKSGFGRILRLHEDGRLDSSFNFTSSADNPILALALQPDGKVVIGGSFTLYGAVARNRIARLNTNGTVDMSFNPSPLLAPSWQVNTSITALTVQPNGQILIGGGFGSVQGFAREGLARLNSNGSLDFSFNPGTGLNRIPTGFTLLPQGRVLLTGEFLSYDGIYRPYLARIFYETCNFPVLNSTTASSICVGSSKSLVGTSGGTWRILSGLGTIVGTTYFASTTGGAVTVRNEIGTCISNTVTFMVEPASPASLGQIDSICRGESTTLTPLSGGASYRFYAVPTGGLPLVGGNNVTTYTTPPLMASTTFYVASVSPAGCEHSERTAVTVPVQAAPSIEIFQQGDTLVAQTSVDSIQWFLDGVKIQGATGRRYFPRISGAYTAKATGVSGCDSTSNAVWVIFAGEKSISLDNSTHWNAFPVPFENELTISGTDKFDFDIINAQGAVVLQGSSAYPNATISTSDLRPGVYTVVIRVNGFFSCKKVIKRGE